MFVHFGVNTFTGKEWGDGTEDPKIFNPTRLDARQWARVAREAGFAGIVLTAKHHDGFALWPSRTTEHSVKNSPWKNGRGDVVKEVAEACREAGLKFGVYLSPWDRHEPTYGTEAYNDFYVNQLTELLTGYGPIFEVWLDGAIGPDVKASPYDTDRWYRVVRELQPDAVMAIAGPDVRYVGNENGEAGETQWSVVGDRWYPSECDVPNRFFTWFWSDPGEILIKRADQLLEIYFQSVGRNCGLLLNVPPNSDGLMSEQDLVPLRVFAASRDRIFARNLAQGAASSASNVRAGDEASYGAALAVDRHDETFWATDDDVVSATLELDLGSPVFFDVIEIEEAIAYGQRVEAYRVEVETNGVFNAVHAGTTIGHKRLARIEGATTRRVRLVIEVSRAAPAIRRLGLYDDKERP